MLDIKSHLTHRRNQKTKVEEPLKTNKLHKNLGLQSLFQLSSKGSPRLLREQQALTLFGVNLVLCIILASTIIHD